MSKVKIVNSDRRVACMFGSDPEMMLRDGNGVRSAIGIVHGTKDDRIRFSDGSTAFHDNVMVECCPVPGRDADEVIANFKSCFSSLSEVVAPFVLSPQASEIYPESECLNELAKRFGCVSEIDCYTGESRMATCPEDSTLRTAGGHVHIGQYPGDSNPWPLLDENNSGKEWFVRCLDVFLGIPSVLMDRDPTSPRRKKLYGGAGYYRKTSYGVEYRTMGNYWLRSPAIVRVVHDIVTYCLWMTRHNFSAFSANWEVLAATVRNTVNTADQAGAAEVFANLPYPNRIKDAVLSIADAPQPDFYSSWGLPEPIAVDNRTRFGNNVFVDCVEAIGL